jgi:tRNA 2-thiouridine synthesizing protein E
MGTMTFGGKVYEVDSIGFLQDYRAWDENFARGLAPLLKIEGLSSRHWQVIRFIRESFEQKGKCPLVYETCKANGLRLRDLEQLFPTGYLRGACRLAGLTYRERAINFFGEGGSTAGTESALALGPADKVYRVDVCGFLVDPSEWDEKFAVHRAYEMKDPCDLTPRHWEVISFLRSHFSRTGQVPTVYQTCEANHTDLDELEALFPDGYQRGAVKIAGLRVK